MKSYLIQKVEDIDNKLEKVEKRVFRTETLQWIFACGFLFKFGSEELVPFITAKIFGG